MNEIQLPVRPGTMASGQVYALIYNSTGQVWSTGTSSFQTYTLNGFLGSGYLLPMTGQIPTSRYFVASVPTTLPADFYYIPIYQRAASNVLPSEQDSVLDHQTLQWNGTGIIPLNRMPVNVVQIGGSGITLLTAVDANVTHWSGARVTPPLTSGIPNVNVVRWSGQPVLVPLVTGSPLVTITGFPLVNVAQWSGTNVLNPSVPGIPMVDTLYWWSGERVLKPVLSGVPLADVAAWSGVRLPPQDNPGYPDINAYYWSGTRIVSPMFNGVPNVHVTHWSGALAAHTYQPGVPTVDVMFWHSGQRVTTPLNSGAVNVTPISGDHLFAKVELGSGSFAYYADVRFIKDTSQDEYTVQWYRNSVPLSSGQFTSPTIQVIKRVDGTDLIASTPMDHISANIGTLKKDEGSALITLGEDYIVKVQAAIDGVTRTWQKIVGRDV